jgi:hypothetical protein
MDDREHDVTTSSSRKPCDQEFLRAEAGKRHPQDTGDFLLVSRFEQAQAGHEDAREGLHVRFCMHRIHPSWSGS